MVWKEESQPRVGEGRGEIKHGFLVQAEQMGLAKVMMIDINHELQTRGFQLTEAHVGYLDVSRFVGRQHDPGAVQVGRVRARAACNCSRVIIVLSFAINGLMKRIKRNSR